MKLDKIIVSIADLTPQRKLEILNNELKKENTKKGKEQILLLIETAKREQEDIEEKLKIIAVKEQPKEEQPLETIVQKEPVSEEALKQDQKAISRLYGMEEKKSQELYGREDLKFGQEDKQKSEYKQAAEDRFTQQREQNFILDEAKRLERERKKYETGRTNQ